MPERARAWRDLARQDLARLRQVCAEELARLEQLIAQRQAEVGAAQDIVRRARSLAGKKVISAEEHQDAERSYQVHQARLEQARAERNAREVEGTLESGERGPDPAPSDLSRKILQALVDEHEVRRNGQDQLTFWMRKRRLQIAG